MSQIFETLLDETAPKNRYCWFGKCLPQQQEPATMFDVPYFIVEALKKAPPEKKLRLLNGTHLLIEQRGPHNK